MNGNANNMNNAAAAAASSPSASSSPHQMNTFELPPIRKIGPAVLPKPKNIKIQAGRATINFSADAGANGHPTITITTTRGPNSPTITATATSPTAASSNQNTFSYNIPVQHIYHSSQPTSITLGGGGGGDSMTATAASPSQPTTTTTTLPFTANGGGNFIISASSLSALPPEFFLNGSMINKPTLIGNGSYVIPVSMKLMNASPASMTATNQQQSQQQQQPTTPPSRNNSVSSGSLPSGMFVFQQQPQQPKQTQQQQQQSSPQSHYINISSPPSSPLTLTSPTNLGNIVIKTSGMGGGIPTIVATTNPGGTTGSGGGRMQSRVEDEVDLLKDLLVRNLNSANQQNFFGICTKCNEKIMGAENGLRAMDNLFHVTCFVCYGCGSQLQGHHFYAMENRSFCENCYMRLLERCSLCSKPITDRILRATGKPFHPECFCCIACKKNLDGIPFTVDASNKIHCIECFHEKYAPKCYICHQSITPEPGQEETVRIVAMDRSFHVNCYKCEECGVSLSSNSENAGGCFPLDDHIYCKPCHMKLLRANTSGGLAQPSSPLTPKFSNNSSNNNNSNQAPRSTDL